MKDIIDPIYTQKNMLKAEQLVFNLFSFHVWLLFLCWFFFVCLYISFWYCLATISRLVQPGPIESINKTKLKVEFLFLFIVQIMCCVCFICYDDDVYSSISFNLYPFVDSSRFFFIRKFCEHCTMLIILNTRNKCNRNNFSTFLFFVFKFVISQERIWTAN